MTVSVIYLDESRRLRRGRSAMAGNRGRDRRRFRRPAARGPASSSVPTAFDRVEIDVQSMRVSMPTPNTEIHAEYILRGFDRVQRAPRRVAAAQFAVSGPDRREGGRHCAHRSTTISPRNRRRDRGASRRVSRDLRGLGDSPRSRPARESPSSSGCSPMPRRRSAICRSPGPRSSPRPRCSCDDSTSVVRRLPSIAIDRRIPSARRGSDGEIRDALTLGMSPHLSEILAWRFRFLRASASAAVLEMVPLSGPADDAGRYGAHCGPNRWRCAPGLDCQPSIVDGDDIGLCLPAGVARPAIRASA